MTGKMNIINGTLMNYVILVVPDEIFVSIVYDRIFYFIVFRISLQINKKPQKQIQ